MHKHLNTAIGNTTMADDMSDMQFLPTIPLPRNLAPGPIPIADMANIFGVTHRTLHFYEEKKILRADRNGAMRVYGPRQIKIMALVNLCRETGMPIAQIQDLLAELENALSQQQADAIFAAAMQARRKELVAEESLIRRQMQQIKEALDHTGLGGDDFESNHGRRAPFLSDFEHECLELMAEGYTPVRIANATRREVDDILTVETSIIRKFGSSNRFQAVAKAVLLGLIGD